MKSWTLDQELSPYEVVARNYASDSSNKMHSDDVAPLYGFKGGLVPGVGVYAYMLHPAVEVLGREWLEKGWITAKFLKPVYDGERATVRGRICALDPLVLELEVFNPDSTLCAVGKAGLNPVRPAPDPADYPHAEPPAEQQRPEARLEALPEGKIFGSIRERFDASAAEKEAREDFLETSPLFNVGDGVFHPACFTALANELLKTNVDLGPWIHTASDVEHYAVPKNGDDLEVRGRVAQSYARRGHEFAVIDLAIFVGDRPIAHVTHTAIVHPRRADAPGSRQTDS